MQYLKIFFISIFLTSALSHSAYSKLDKLETITNKQAQVQAIRKIFNHLELVKLLPYNNTIPFAYLDGHIQASSLVDNLTGELDENTKKSRHMKQEYSKFTWDYTVKTNQEKSLIFFSLSMEPTKSAHFTDPRISYSILSDTSHFTPNIIMNSSTKYITGENKTALVKFTTIKLENETVNKARKIILGNSEPLYLTNVRIKTVDEGVTRGNIHQPSEHTDNTFFKWIALGKGAFKETHHWFKSEMNKAGARQSMYIDYNTKRPNNHPFVDRMSENEYRSKTLTRRHNRKSKNLLVTKHW